MADKLIPITTCKPYRVAHNARRCHISSVTSCKLESKKEWLGWTYVKIDRICSMIASFVILCRCSYYTERRNMKRDNDSQYEKQRSDLYRLAEMQTLALAGKWIEHDGKRVQVDHVTASIAGIHVRYNVVCLNGAVMKPLEACTFVDAPQKASVSKMMYSEFLAGLEASGSR